MSLFRKTVSTRCSGDKSPQCPNFINKTPLPAHKRHCPDPNCGSSVIEDTVPNVPAIAALVIALVVSAGGISYLVWQRGFNTPTPTPTDLSATPTPTPTDSIATPTPTPTDLSTTPTPTPTDLSATPTPTPTDSIATPTPTPTSTPVSPVRLPPPPPTTEEIKTAILKLKKMNPNELLEFPVEEDPDNYRVIGVKDSKGSYWYWTAKTVQDFLEESLEQGGKFSEKNNKVSLVVRNQSTGTELPNVSIDKNELLARFVRSITLME